MNTIHFELVKDVSRAYQLWKNFSSEDTLFESWDFRYCFYKYFKYELFFYVGYVADELIGLLPLQFNSDKNYLEFFGGSFMDDNQLFIKQGYEQYISAFYTYLDPPHHLTYITGEDEFTRGLPIEDYKYILPLNSFKTSDEYIETYFQGETKKKLRKRIQKIAELPITVSYDHYEDMETLFMLNEEKFGVESSFHKPYRKQIFLDLLRPPFRPQLLTFFIGDQKVAVNFALIFKEYYTSLNSGIRSEVPKDFVSYMRVKKIDEALKLSLGTYDFLSGDCGWKEHWHLHKVPQYVFKNI